jgi:hypothetical protein
LVCSSSTLPHQPLTDTIDAYRTELALETERVLAHTEHGLNNQLEQITEEFGGGLKIVAEHEDNIFKPISEERLEITKSSPEKNGQALKQHVTLAGRMREFETLVATEATHLEALWKEWHATNLELVCLAIEVLGPDGVELAFNQDDKRTAAQINAAVDASRGDEARHNAFKEQAADMEHLVSMNAQETVNSLIEQEKVRQPFDVLAKLAKLTCHSSVRSGGSTRRRRYRRSSRL